MAVRIQFRRGTAAEWFSTNPILAVGEVGFETDTRKFKIGTGDKRWNDVSFPYYAQGTITSVIAGGGLTGGGSNGEVTLSLDSAVLTGTVFNNRGDLLTATANNEPSLLPVGSTDFDVLQVTSTSVNGLSYGKVKSTAIENNAITESKILDTSVSTSKIRDLSISTEKIINGAVTDTKLASNSVVTSKINNGAVTTDKLATSSVTTDKIADLAITGSKFADNIITSAKIANGTIVNDDISASAGIDLTKLNTGNLPTAIKTVSGNYTDRSITVSKLSNTAGSEGIGVWQSWTPTVSGLTTSQWDIIYSKYMKLNNTCQVHTAIRVKDTPSRLNTNVSFDLPLVPVFAANLQSGDKIAIGSFLHQSDEERYFRWWYGGSTTAIYRNGVVIPWGGWRYWWYYSRYNYDFYFDVQTNDVISFTVTYEVA